MRKVLATTAFVLAALAGFVLAGAIAIVVGSFLQEQVGVKGECELPRITLCFESPGGSLECKEIRKCDDAKPGTPCLW